MSREISLNNKYRVLLTEVLPYELPLMLDNEGLYLNIQDKDLCKIFKEAFPWKQDQWTIPFDYSVRKYGGGKNRMLSLMHPFVQLRWVDFYADHDYYMLYLCNKSPFSIRHIADRAKCIFEIEEDKDQPTINFPKRVEVLDGEIEKRYRSYFSYKRYDMMYKFFDSGDFLRLEQKYTHLLKMDIASCFYHIYTHTISWAIKGKEQAKELIKKKTFENDFDSLMQQTNYNETNGIIVGPEISRIFAEIIFQRIDVNVLNRLKQKNASLKLGRDYEVRRYVDDHYIYANSEENLLAILEIYKEELQYYKLFINESKLDFSSRPFVSDVSDAKHDINKLVSTIAEKWLEKDNDNNYKYVVKNGMKIFTSVVNEFRSLTYRHNQKYGNINRYFLSLLASQIGNELNREHIPEPSLGLLIMYTEIGFYVFSLDMNASASIKICRILEHLHRWAEHCNDKTILTELESRIYREVKRCLDIYEAKYEDGAANIEVLNLLLCMNRLMKTPIPTSQLEKVFNISNNKVEDFKQLNYFQICTLLYIIGNDACYDNIRKRIAAEVCRRLTEEYSMYHSDNAMLFFDAMVCPYIHFQKKQIRQIIQKVYKCSDSAYGNKYIELTKTRRWFFNWDKTYPLSEALSKKEYHSPYE